MELNKLEEIINNTDVFNYIKNLILKEFKNYPFNILEGLNSKHLCLYKNGIEITFSLNNQIEHIRLMINVVEYNSEYLIYSYKLPWGLNKEMKKDDIRMVLGKPSSIHEKFENSMIRVPLSEKYEKESGYIEFHYNNDMKLCAIGIGFS